MGASFIFSVVLLMFMWVSVAEAAVNTDTLKAYIPMSSPARVTGANAFPNHSGDAVNPAVFGGSGSNVGPQGYSASVAPITFNDNPASQDYDDTDDYFTVPNGLPQPAYTDATWTGWARMDSTSSGSDLIFWHPATRPYIDRNGTDLNFFYEIDGASPQTRTISSLNSKVSNGEWFFWYFTFDFPAVQGGIITTNGTHYSTGTSHGSGSYFGLDETDTHYGGSPGLSRILSGQLDDLRIYSRRLTNTELLAIAAGDNPTNTWTGSSNTTFDTAGNWDGSYMPDPLTNVVIADVANDPILNAHTTVQDMTLNSSASLNMSGKNLTVNGTLTVGSGATLTLGGGDLTVETLVNNGTIILRGDETVNIETFDSDSGTVRYVGDGDAAADSYVLKDFDYYNLEVNFTDSNDSLDVTETLASNLRVHYKFDEGTNSTNATDSSGNGKTGTVNGNPTASADVPAAINFSDPYSVDLDGTGDYFTYNENPDVTGESTMSVWFKADSNTQFTNNSIFSSTNGDTVTSSSQLDLGITCGNGNGTDTNGIRFPLLSPTLSTTYCISDATITADQWYHVIVVFNGSNLFLYLDGEKKVSIPLPSDFDNEIGSYNVGTNRGVNSPLDGHIDDFRFYNKALDSWEIAALYTGLNDDTISALDVNGTLTITSGTLDMDETDLTIGASFSNSGTFSQTNTLVTLDAASGSQTITSGGDSFYDLTLNDGGGSATWTLEDALDVDNNLTITGGTLDTKSGENNSINVGGSWSNSDTFTARSGTVTFDAASGSKTITSNSNPFNAVTFNDGGGSATWTLSDAFDANSNLTITGGTLDTGNNSMAIGGNWSNSDSFVSGSSTVTFDAASGTQTINAGGTGSDTTDFNNLVKSGAGILQLITSALEIDGAFTISSNTTVDLNGQNLTNTGGTFSNDGTLLLQGDETVTGLTGDGDSGQVTYDGAVTATVSDIGPFYNLTFDNASGAWTQPAAAWDVNNNFAITNGSFTSGGQNMSVAGNWTNAGTYVSGANTVTFDGTGTQTLISGGTADGNDFNNMTVNKTAGVLTLSTNGVDIDGNLTITDGTLDIEGQNLTVTGTFSNEDTLRMQGGETVTLTADTDSGTVEYDGTSDYLTALAYGNTYYHLLFNGSGGVWEPDGAVTVNGNLTITDGTFDIDGQSLTLDAASVFSNDGTLRLQNTETITNVTNDTNSGTTEYDGAGTYNSLTFGDTYYNLVLSNGTHTLASSKDIDGAFTLSSGSLDFAGNAMSVAGNFTSSGTLSGTSASTLTLDGTGAQNWDSDGATWSTVAIAGGGGTVTTTSDATVSSSLTIASGDTLAIATGVTLTSNGTITNSGTLSEAGTGKVADPSSALSFIDDNVDEKTFYTLGSDQVYVSLDDEDGNLSGSSLDTLTVTVSCSTDSEAITLTETTNTSETFRNIASGGLTTEEYSGSATTNDGTLSCEDATTMTVTYTDAQDNADTRSDTSTATIDAQAAAPTNLTVAASTPTTVTLTWTDNSSNEDGFKLYDENDTLLATIATPNTTSYQVTGLTQETTYSYYITAYNGAGDSDPSSTVSVTTPAGNGNQPSSFNLLAPNNGAYVNTGLVTFRFQQATDIDEDITSYTLVIDDTHSLTIPISANASNPLSKTHVADTFTATYLNENDGNPANNEIRVVLRSSAIFPLATGLHSWYVRVTDETNVTRTSATRSFTVDTAAPTLSGVNNVTTTSVKPSFSFTATDSIGLSQLTVQLRRQQQLLGFTTSLVTLQTATYAVNGTQQTVNFTPTNDLTPGSNYTIVVTATDLAGNVVTRSMTVTVLTAEEAAALETTDLDTAPLPDLLERVRNLLPESLVSIPELQAQALLRREAQREQFNRLLDYLQDWALALLERSSLLERSVFAASTQVTSWWEQFRTAVVAFGQALYDTGRTVVAAVRETTLLAWESLLTAQHRITLDALSWAARLANAIDAGTDRVFGFELVRLAQQGSQVFEIPQLELTRRFDTESREQPAVATLGVWERVRTVLTTSQETRIRSGLKNRELVGKRVTRAIEPVLSFGRRVTQLARYNYEVLFDQEPTRISNIRITSLTPTSAVVEWATNHVTRTGKVNFGTTTTYTREALVPDRLTDQHRVVLTDLEPETTYYFEVMNQNGDYVFDAYYTLTTPPDGAPSLSQSLVPQTATTLVEATVYAEPDTQSEQFTTLVPDTTLRALNTADGWVSVLLPDGREGWLERDLVKLSEQTGETGVTREVF